MQDQKSQPCNILNSKKVFHSSCESAKKVKTPHGENMYGVPAASTLPPPFFCMLFEKILPVHYDNMYV